MEESILTTIKKMLGITEEYKHFDTDIVIHINSALMVLHQLGVGLDKPGRIASEMDTWVSVLGETEDIEAIKTYVYIKVKLIFDPPTNSSVLNAYKEELKELEWRLNVQVDNGEEE